MSLASHFQSRIDAWSRLHAGAMLLAVSAYLIWREPTILAALGGLSFGMFAYRLRIEWQLKSSWGGAANWVTAARLSLLFLLLTVGQSWPDLVIGGLALLTLVTDGLDGYLARKYQTQSLFGEYLDKETDAFFVMSLGLLAWHHSKIGIWVLGLGLLRYAYVLALIFFKPAEKKESRSFFGQLVAVILMSTLIACFVLPRIIYEPALMLVSGLTVYSFGKSFWGMSRRTGVKQVPQKVKEVVKV
ncbi:MAG: CDP-alcohol phosphatidyltransferase family protein [Bacteroidota bacterium]